MYTFLMVVLVLVAVALIALILLQQGKGADAGAAFGSGGSSTVFGARGSANFLSRSTAWLATAFFGISLALGYLVNVQRPADSVVDKVPAAVEAKIDGEVPAAPVAPADVTPKVPE